MMINCLTIKILGSLFSATPLGKILMWVFLQDKIKEEFGKSGKVLTPGPSFSVVRVLPLDTIYLYLSISIYICIYKYTCSYNLDLIFTSSWGISIICTYMGMSLVSDIILYFVKLPSATEITSAHLQTDNKANLWQCPGEVSHTGVLKPWIPSRHRGLTYTKMI